MPSPLRVAIVTGAGAGIGRAIALRLAADGASVAVAERQPERGEETARLIREGGGEALPVQTDVSKAAEVGELVRAALERYGRVDVLVNNVSFGRGDDILSIDEATWDAVLAGTLKSVYLCSRAVLPSMLESGRGAIVNIGSVNGLAAFGHHAYSAAKAGVISLTQNMAIEYGRRGIRTNCICPGTIQTGAWKGRLERQPDLFERIVPWYPARRLGLPEDVAAAAAFLASDEAGFINGATLVVDGGLMAGVEGLARTIRSEPERVPDR